MKLKLRTHQKQAIKRMQDKEFFGLFMEQGTGKSACFIGEAEELFANGKIDAMLIIAPK